MAEVGSKLHLASKGFVTIWFKMLTYCVYAPLLNPIDASPLKASYNFETASYDLLRFTRANARARRSEIQKLPDAIVIQ